MRLYIENTIYVEKKFINIANFTTIGFVIKNSYESWYLSADDSFVRKDRYKGHNLYWL